MREISEVKFAKERQFPTLRYLNLTVNVFVYSWFA